MAEYLFIDKITKLKPELSKNITISSAGTHAVHQGEISTHAKKLLNEENIICNQHQSSQITKNIIYNNDLILVMENIHKYNIKNIAPESLGKVFLLGHWGKNEIADPYQKDLTYFREIKQQINQGIECWFKKMFL